MLNTQADSIQKNVWLQDYDQIKKCMQDLMEPKPIVELHTI